MSYNPNLPAGATTASASAPVALATDQIGDVIVTGQASQSTLGNNILLATAGSGATDCMAQGATYRSFATQIIASAGIAAGQIIFEESNDGTTWNPAIVWDDASPAGSFYYFATAIGASTNRFFSGRLTRRYFRCRISTAFSGGTVQAITKFSSLDMSSRWTQVLQLTAANMQASVAPAVPTTYTGITTASTNAASVIGFAKTVISYALSNPTATPAFVKFYNKGSAPTVGTDVPILTVPVPANSCVVHDYSFGFRFTTGIAIATTGANTDSDTSNAVAGVHIVVNYTG